MPTDEKKDGLQFSTAEVEALKDLVEFALEADIVRAPFEDATQRVLEKLGLLPEEDARAYETPPGRSYRTPVQMQ